VDNFTDKMQELPIPTDGKTGKMFFEWMMFPYYRKAFEILVERQRRYGPENILKAGEWGVMEQIQNKVSRARAQLNGSIEAGSVVLDEMSPETAAVYRDSLVDLVNYSIILLALSDGAWTREMVVEDESSIRPYGLDAAIYEDLVR
jgi:hypothetical protein